MNYISEHTIKKEAWKFYIAAPMWLLYFFFLPKVFISSKALFFLYLFFVGNFLFSWMGYLFHESWHEYVPNVSNKFLFNLYGILLFSDPQIYRLTHGSHHAKAHTYEDLEFYPIGEIKHKTTKILYRLTEFIVGTAFILTIHSMVLPRHEKTKDKFSKSSNFLSLLMVVVIYTCVISLSYSFFSLSLNQVIACYILSIWMHSFFLHQSQLVEHGFLIKEGSALERNLCTRNVSPTGFIERVFLLLTHNDPEEHVFHHIYAREYLRPFPGVVPFPENSNKITLKHYFFLMLRGLSGDDLSE